jgi:hypothetical protein
MRLSVVRNLILKGSSDDIPASGFLVIDAVELQSMYFVVMLRVSLIVILVMYVRYLYSINCPIVICLPSMLYLTYGETPLVNCGPRSNFLYIPLPFYLTWTIYFTSFTIILLPLDTLIPLFTANWWDWQPHRKLGAKYLFVLCAGFTLLLGEDTPTSCLAPFDACGGVIFSPSSWEPQEEGMMNIAARFFPQLRNQGMSIRRGRNKYDWRWCLLACDNSGQFIRRLVQALLC